MSKEDFRLSVEELGLALSLMGQQEMGRTLLEVHLGEMEPKEIDIKFHTAAHSLLARDWIRLKEELAFEISEPLSDVVRVLIEADFSIQYRRSYEDGEFLLTYHFIKDVFYRHAVDWGVVHQITKVHNLEAVVEGGLDFFEMDSLETFRTTQMRIPYLKFEELAEIQDESELMGKLGAFGASEKMSSLLADDLLHTYFRGGILRIEYPEGEEPKSDFGLLTLQGSDRLWLLRIEDDNGEAMLNIMPGTKKAFREEVKSLIKSE